MPQNYCSVCGKTTVSAAARACVSPNCANSAHIACLGSETEFDCSKVCSLRENLGITAPVSYKEDNNTASSQSGEADTNDTNPSLTSEDDTEDLLELPPSELVNIIRNLRLELSRKNKLIRFYGNASSNISGARDAVVSVLDFIDSIAANSSSSEALNTRTIASSARSEWIDNAWVNHVTTNQDAQAWWTSDNPLPLRSGTTAFPPGPRLAGPDQPVDRVTGLDSPTHSGSDASSQTQPDSNTHDLAVTDTLGSSTAASGPDLPGAASNPVQQRPNRSFNSHSAQPPTSNRGQQRAPKSTRIPPSGNFVNNAQRQVSQSNNLNYKRTQVPKPSLSSASLSRPAPIQFCYYCKRKGHTESSCLRKKRCDYCHRQGHSIEDCHTRFAEERQQQFLNRISNDQAQNNAILVQSLSRLLAPASLLPAAPALPPHGNLAAQPTLPSHQQPPQTYSGPAQPPYSHPGVWSHAG